MFGIGLPELIVILGLALIVVGPDKLPDLARSIAKGVLELKKTAEGLKHELTQEGGMLEDLRPEIDAVKTLKKELAESTHIDWQNDKPIDTPHIVKDVADTSKEAGDEKETPLSEKSADSEPSPGEGSGSSDHPKTAIEDEKQADDAGKKP
jgi:Tat protein translocase TatB subunit